MISKQLLASSAFGLTEAKKILRRPTRKGVKSQVAVTRSRGTRFSRRSTPD